MRGKEYSRAPTYQPYGITPAYAGKSKTAKLRRRMTGITPAYAGKSVSVIWLVSQPQDHPRVCGEKPLVRLTEKALRGSPPRMRGKVLSIHFLCRHLRITPAYAGKRAGPATACGGSWDHPRVCGEKDKWRGLMHSPEGSPPRMRGKDFITSPKNCRAGITPAYAGKRLCYPFFLSPLWDHPRVCGEKTQV